MSANIIGISSHSHESACCVLREGKLIAAANEERFTRNKHEPSIPQHAFRYCLRESGLSITDIDSVAYYEDPQEKLHRQIWMMTPGLLRNGDFLGRLDSTRPIRDIRQALGYDGPIHIVKHHEAHAASSFYYSGFPEAAVLTVDGVGEWATTTYGRASSASGIDLFEEVHFPHSLGLFYSAMTSYLGFEVNDGEYKVMGLAPYGKDRYSDEIQKLIELSSGGQYRLNLKYFDFQSLMRMYSNELPMLLGQPPRQPGSEIKPFHQDVARSTQAVLQRVLLDKLRYLHQQVGADALCMAGGVALNCVANSAILRQGPFRQMFVQPASGDAGGAIGAASLAHVKIHGSGDFGSRLEHVYLGPAYSITEIRKIIEAIKLNALDFHSSEDDLLAATAERLADGKVVGWFHGRMEFGPRALGARSILADPRNPDMRDRINDMVKKRESFRPFAPSVLLSKAREHFDISQASPFMLETCQVISPLALPAITHVDGSARVQTVDHQTNPRFCRLLERFEQRTGCPILLNTSFNMKDEPIVCDPIDALFCFFRSNIDSLVLEDFILDRSALGELRRNLCNIEAPHKAVITHRIYTLF